MIGIDAFELVVYVSETRAEADLRSGEIGSIYHLTDRFPLERIREHARKSGLRGKHGVLVPK